MCNFFSCIVDRNENVYHLAQMTDSHEDIITQNKLDDSKLENRDIVRIEVIPLNWEKLTAKFATRQWNYHEDEKSTLPDWYLKNKKKLRSLVFSELQKVYEELFVFEGEKVIYTGRLFSYGSSQVESYDSSQVESYGSSQVKSYDSSQVKSYDSSQVKSYDSSQVESYDSSNIIYFSGSIDAKANSAIIDRSEWGKVEVYKAPKKLG